MAALESILGAAPVVATRVGEVVSTSIAELEAQCPRLHDAPPLGALVRVQVEQDFVLFGIVAGCSTDGVDAGARPVPRGRDGCEDADIYREHPDLAFVLRTCFRSLVVGFQQGGHMFHYLPPRSAPIHYSVTLCSSVEAELFTHSLDYFRIVLDAPNVPNEEVLAAHVRVVAGTLGESGSFVEGSRRFTVRAGKEVATLLRGDHQRLMTILKRIRPPVSLSSPSMLA
jgi:hypothetical protein